MTASSDVDRGWAWLVAAASFIVHILTYGFSWSTGVYNIIFLDVFNDSKTATAWAGSLTTASMYAAGADEERIQKKCYDDNETHSG